MTLFFAGLSTSSQQDARVGSRGCDVTSAIRSVACAQSTADTGPGVWAQHLNVMCNLNPAIHMWPLCFHFVFASIAVSTVCSFIVQLSLWFS